MIRQQQNDFFIFLVPNLYPSQMAGVLLTRIKALHLDDLVFQNIPILGNVSFLQNPVTSIFFLASDKKDAALAPSSKEFIIDIPFVYRHNRTGRKAHRLGNLYLVTLPIGDMSKYGQVTVMIQKQMEFHRPFRLTELGPVKEASTKLNHRGIQTEKLVLETKTAFSKA